MQVKNTNLIHLMPRLQSSHFVRNTVVPEMPLRADSVSSIQRKNKKERDTLKELRFRALSLSPFRRRSHRQKTVEEEQADPLAVTCTSSYSA